MAGFSTKSFIKYDDYMTPKYAWENIKDYIPNNKIIWECFFGDGKSGNDLKDMGFSVIHEEIDFFKNNKGDILISNPPFSKKKEVFKRLKQLDKPFIMICPLNVINSNYIRDLFNDSNDRLQIIIPRKRIQFIKKVNGEIPKDNENKCNFDCFYYCYKLNLDRDIIWLK